MADPALVHPLAGRLEALAGDVDPDGVAVGLPVHAGLWQILALARGGGDVSRRLQRLVCDGAGAEIRAAGPGEWLVLLAAGEAAGFEATLCEQLADKAAVIDQSHARMAIRIEGAPVRDMLAKGTAIDLHPRRFAPGQSATTMIGHFTIHLTRVGEDGFELLVTRSFAESFLDALIEMGREYGLYPRMRS